MTRFAGYSTLLAIAIAVGPTDSASAQHPGMSMSMNTLLAVQLDADQVVGGSSSTATGTGAFLLEPVRHALEYSLTYEGLISGGARSVALHNFGKGKNGDVVVVLCGTNAPPCPTGASATLSGRLEGAEGRSLDNRLIGEFDSERVYVEIVGADGKSEIRGQLAPNGAMVKVVNYVAHLQPAAGSDSKGSGTAIFSETYLPGGKVSVFYRATVAGTSTAPTNMGLVARPKAQGNTFTGRLALPELKRSPSSGNATGGSLTGLYVVESTARGAVFAARLLSAGEGEVGIVVTTSRRPNGELYGVLSPVR